MRIMIIGFGQIGKRHFQSLLGLKSRVNIYLVDPIFKNKNILEAELVKPNIKVACFEDLEDYREQKILLDLCIIATNSDKRMYLLNKIILLFNVKNIILEKFLFNKVSDYSKALKLCRDRHGFIFVNQWMCQSLVIRNILSEFKNDSLDVKVTGIEWGMGCNILHFIDLVRYFNINDEDFPKIIEQNLNPRIRQAKREGFYEIYGNLSIKYGKHNLFVECCESDFPVGSTPNGINIEIKVKNLKNKFIKFSLKSGWINGEKNINGKVTKFSKKIELISGMTRDIFRKLTLNKKIYLPNLEQSINQHIIICKIFARHFEKIMKIKIGLCPIT